MTDVIIVGTDTGEGKTALAVLWLAAQSQHFEYWKPLETGDSDTDCVRRCVPGAVAHAPLARFASPVAPLLAARQENRPVPTAAEIANARPRPAEPGRHLLIETFGSPLSPLNDDELQEKLLRELRVPVVLVCSSAVGAIGRTLQCLAALKAHGIRPAAAVLMGPSDKFAIEQLNRHAPAVATFSVELPSRWDADGVTCSAQEQAEVLAALVQQTPSMAAAQYAAADLLDRDERLVWHPYTSLHDPVRPLLAVAAEDEFLCLADGRRVVDGISSWWTILHGHRYPPLMTALDEAARSLDHVQFAGVTHPAAIELAGLLLSTAPWSGGRVFYSDNGSTAVEVALKMAYQFWCHQREPGRTWFVGLQGGYHGDTFGAMSVSRDPLFFGKFAPLLFQAEIAPPSAEQLDAVLKKRAGKVAAVIVEPLIQGAGGMRMYSAQALGEMASVAQRHGVLFIADEVMTGGGRTGTLWAHQAAGIAPDLICAAKTLAGGVLPLAATLASPSVVAAWDTADRSRTFFHGHSFTAHPLACAVAVANWTMLTQMAPTAGQRMAHFWDQALIPLRDHPRVREVRVCGTVAAVELDLPGGYLAPVGRQLQSTCLAEGVLLRPLGSVLYAMPPYCTSDASLEAIARAMRKAVDTLPLDP